MCIENTSIDVYTYAYSLHINLLVTLAFTCVHANMYLACIPAGTQPCPQAMWQYATLPAVWFGCDLNNFGHCCGQTLLEDNTYLDLDTDSKSCLSFSLTVTPNH